MGGTPGPKSASANMEFKEMKEEVTTPPTVEYEHIKVLIIPFFYIFFVHFVFFFLYLFPILIFVFWRCFPLESF